MPLVHEDLQHTSDARLVALCLQGDQSAWEALVNRYVRLVYSIALKSGISPSNADDVVQNVFVTVLRKLETVRERDRFSSWLITTARRESWHFKSRDRELALDDEVEVVDESETAEDSLIAWEQVHLVQRAVQELGDRCRRLITAIFLTEERPSYQEIAQDLEIAVGSIGPIRARCLQQLRGHLVDVGFKGGV